jgi:signal transduction histidine kinase
MRWTQRNDIEYPWLFKARCFKFIIVLVFISIFGTALIVSYQQYRDGVFRSIEENKSTANLLSIIIQEHQKAAIGIIQAHASRPDLINAAKERDSGEMLTHFLNLKKDNPEIDMVVVTDDKGILWANFPDFKESHGRNFSHRDWYKGVSQRWKPYVSSVYKQVVGEKDLAVMVCAPIFDQERNAIGILGTTQRTVFLGNIIEGIGFDPDTIITLVDQEGHIIYSNRFAYQKEITQYPSFAFLKSRAQEGQGSPAIRVPSEGNRVRFVVYAPLREMGWTVIVEKGRREILKSESGFFVQMAAISLLLFLLIASSLVYLRKGIARQKLEEQRIRRLNEELEERVRQRTDDLLRANKELEGFSYSVSHDLRAPLRSIDGFSQALLEDYAEKLDETGKDYLQRVRSGAQKMSELIDAMLSLSHLTRGEIKRETVDLTALAKSIASDLKKTEPERQVEFEFAEGVAVKGDPVMIRALLENLFRNAWKFTGKHPTARIAFGVTETENRPVYFVRDDGVGFDMAYKEKLFGAFQRLHASVDFPGIGIGLATVQRIVHRHGGHIWAEGEVGKGATFYFSLSDGGLDGKENHFTGGG